MSAAKVKIYNNRKKFGIGFSAAIYNAKFSQNKAVKLYIVLKNN